MSQPSRRLGIGTAAAVCALLILAGGGLGSAGSVAGPAPQPATPVAVFPNGYALNPSAGAAVVPGQVVVRFRSGGSTKADAQTNAQNVLSAIGMTATVQSELLTPNSYVLNVASGQEQAAAELLGAQPQVEAASPNLVRHIQAAAVVPSDPLYSQQWAWPRVDAPAAWSVPQVPGVLVAVLDTGLDLTHPEFAGRIAPGANFVTPGAAPQDDNGHGTHVAGLIAAGANNGIGGAGLAWQARIMPIKVADAAGNLTSAAWINGLALAAQYHAQVINMSFGGVSYSGVEQAAVTDAWNSGAVIVAAAGNAADSGNPVEYPAAYDHVISVAAVGNDNTRAYYSESNRYVMVAAPGGNAHFSNDPPDRFILSTWPQGLNGNVQQGYGREIGTSQAAAIVSGLAALMFSTGPGWTNSSVVQQITHTATDLGAPGRDDAYGYGLIDVAAAIASSPGLPPPTLPPPPPAPPSVTPRPSATRVPPPPPTVAPPTAVPTRPPAPPTAVPTRPRDCLYADVCAGVDWFAPFVQDLGQRGLLHGYRDGTFRPAALITRGEVAKLLVLGAALPLGGLDGPHFADVPPTHPFYAYIETAYAADILHGYRDGTFQPDAPITRAQLAKLLVLAQGWPLDDPPTVAFRDVPAGSAFYYYVATVAALQVMPGYADATFHPDVLVSRADAAQIVDIALATYRPAIGGGP